MGYGGLKTNRLDDLLFQGEIHLAPSPLYWKSEIRGRKLEFHFLTSDFQHQKAAHRAAF